MTVKNEKKSSSYYHVTDGEWLPVQKRGFREQCCDCALIHRVNYRIVDGAIEVQSFRDNRATAAARRKRK